jgi:hypothetical protein
MVSFMAMVRAGGGDPLVSVVMRAGFEDWLADAGGVIVWPTPESVSRMETHSMI